MKRVFGKFSKLKGSILAYTLILLGIVLTASMGMFMSSMRDLRSVGTQNRSMQAFQIANSGSEMAVSAIKKNPTPNNLIGLANQIGGVGGGVNCDSATGEIVRGTNPPYYLGGEVRLSFFDDEGDKITDCDESISTIASVKSVGTFKETARAVEVAVAAGGGCGNPDNAGKYIMVTKNDSGNTFNSGHWNDVNQFVSPLYGGVITRFGCNPSSGGFGGKAVDSGFAVDAFVTEATLPSSFKRIVFGSGSSGGCNYEGGGTLAGKCYNPASNPCDGGWKIVGICPAL